MKLGAKDLKEFRKSVSKWVGVLGLNGWNVYVEWEKEDQSALAITRLNVKSHLATISLVKDWGTTSFIDKSLDEVAFHECCHILLGDLARVAEDNAPSSMYDVIQGMEHAVIRTLENLVFRIPTK